MISAAPRVLAAVQNADTTACDDEHLAIREHHS
jgi:hypothetical protein